MKDRYLESLGSTIREARKKRGFTQEDLSEKAGIHYTFLGHIERGTKVPSLSTLLKLSSALDCPPCYFFKEHPASQRCRKGSSGRHC